MYEDFSNRWIDLETVLLEKEKLFVFDINIKAINENNGTDIIPPYFKKNRLFIFAEGRGFEPL